MKTAGAASASAFRYSPPSAYSFLFDKLSTFSIFEFSSTIASAMMVTRMELSSTMLLLGIRGMYVVNYYLPRRKSTWGAYGHMEWMDNWTIDIHPYICTTKQTIVTAR